MCEAYNSEWAFCTYLEQSGQAFKCKVCFQVSYLQNTHCSFCRQKERDAKRTALQQAKEE